MKSASTTTRTGIAITFAILGLALIAVGIFRAFNGTGSGIEIMSATGLFGFSALLANGYLSPRIVTVCAVACLSLPVLPT